MANFSPGDASVEIQKSEEDVEEKTYGCIAGFLSYIESSRIAGVFPGLASASKRSNDTSSECSASKTEALEYHSRYSVDSPVPSQDLSADFKNGFKSILGNSAYSPRTSTSTETSSFSPGSFDVNRSDLPLLTREPPRPSFLRSEKQREHPRTSTDSRISTSSRFSLVSFRESERSSPGLLARLMGLDEPAPSPRSDDEKPRSSSVIARLMGLNSMSDGDSGNENRDDRRRSNLVFASRVSSESSPSFGTFSEHEMNSPSTQMISHYGASSPTSYSKETDNQTPPLSPSWHKKGKEQRRSQKHPMEPAPWSLKNNNSIYNSPATKGSDHCTRHITQTDRPVSPRKVHNDLEYLKTILRFPKLSALKDDRQAERRQSKSGELSSSRGSTDATLAVMEESLSFPTDASYFSAINHDFKPKNRDKSGRENIKKVSHARSNVSKKELSFTDSSTLKQRREPGKKKSLKRETDLRSRSPQKEYNMLSSPSRKENKLPSKLIGSKPTAQKGSKSVTDTRSRSSSYRAKEKKSQTPSTKPATQVSMRNRASTVHKKKTKEASEVKSGNKKLVRNSLNEGSMNSEKNMRHNITNIVQKSSSSCTTNKDICNVNSKDPVLSIDAIQGSTDTFENTCEKISLANNDVSWCKEDNPLAPDNLKPAVNKASSDVNDVFACQEDGSLSPEQVNCIGNEGTFGVADVSLCEEDSSLTPTVENSIASSEFYLSLWEEDNSLAPEENLMAEDIAHINDVSVCQEDSSLSPKKVNSIGTFGVADVSLFEEDSILPRTVDNSIAPSEFDFSAWEEDNSLAPEENLIVNEALSVIYDGSRTLNSDCLTATMDVVTVTVSGDDNSEMEDYQIEHEELYHYVEDILLEADLLAEQEEVEFYATDAVTDPQLFHELENKYSTSSYSSTPMERRLMFDLVNEILCEKLVEYALQKWSPSPNRFSHITPTGPHLLREIWNDIQTLRSSYSPNSRVHRCKMWLLKDPSPLEAFSVFKTDLYTLPWSENTHKGKNLPIDFQYEMLHAADIIEELIRRDIVDEVVVDILDISWKKGALQQRRQCSNTSG